MYFLCFNKLVDVGNSGANLLRTIPIIVVVFKLPTDEWCPSLSDLKYIFYYIPRRTTVIVLF